MKNEGASVLTTFIQLEVDGIYSGAQGQMILQSVIESDRNTIYSEISWLSSLPAKMKEIQTKMKVVEC